MNGIKKNVTLVINRYIYKAERDWFSCCSVYDLHRKRKENVRKTQTSKAMPQAHTSNNPNEKGVPHMIVRERSGTLTDFSVLFQLVVTYRAPMTVKEAVIFHHLLQDSLYYYCPRCQRMLEREFLSYCSGCGQCLNWDQYRKCKRTRFQPKR